MVTGATLSKVATSSSHTLTEIRANSSGGAFQATPGGLQKLRRAMNDAIRKMPCLDGLITHDRFLAMMKRRCRDRGVTGVLFFLQLVAALDGLASDRVIAWGAGTFVASPPDDNDFGQSIVPPGLTNVAMVAGGWRHSLALTA